MLDRADIGVLIGIGIVLTSFVFVNYWTLRRDSAKVQKYRLFRVRDEFVYLVAVGKLREDEFLFQKFYKGINALLDRTKDHLSLKGFLRATRELQEKGLDPAEREDLDRIIDELKKRNDQEIVDAVLSFFDSMYTITLENSLMVRFLQALNGFAVKLRFLAALFPREGAAYRLSRHYQQASKDLAAAA